MSDGHFETMYANGETPWELHRPDSNLTTTIKRLGMNRGPALDIGCGTGDNTIWLAQRGFTATGCDRVQLAISQARTKADRAGVHCSFQVLDFLKDDIPSGLFSFVFDRGCFHSFDRENDRSLFAEKAARLLQPKGIWLSLIGNADEKREAPGPPQCSARDIVIAVEPWFEILSLVANHFDSNLNPPPRNWVCLMKKRS